MARIISTIPVTKNQSVDEFESFMEVFPIIVEDLTKVVRKDMPQLKSHMEQLFNYVVANSGNARGLVLPAVYRMFEQEKLTSKNIRLSYIMGWMTEIGLAGAALFEDIIDGSEVRRGLPCWHTKNGIGLNGANDGVILEHTIYFLIAKYFADHPQVLSLYQLIHSMSMKITWGIAVSRRLIKNGKPVLKLFTVENYRSIVKYKIAYSGFYTPVALAMYLANIEDAKLYKDIEPILLEIGQLYQMQDDFSDCFGDVEKTGIRGKYIRESKCTWLVVKALEKVNSEQRKIIEKHYGSTDPEAVEIICNLYEELDLAKLHAEEKQEKFHYIQSLMRQVSDDFPSELFTTIMEVMLTQL